MAKRARPNSRGSRSGVPADEKPLPQATVAWRASGDGRGSPAGNRPAGPPLAATALLEAGMVALQRHDYSEAAARFVRLLAEFQDEGALLDRARVYLGLCERELAARPAPPATLEERLTAATAALNNDEAAEAERLVRLVLSEEPEHDLALYLLAAIEARRGAVDAALQYLSQAVAVSPEAGAQARHDPDFQVLRGTELFAEITGRPTPTARPSRRRHAAER